MENRGAILGDDMGLGKTVQVSLISYFPFFFSL
jgi:SNF2 family DNA or RNA helicase